jgi:drug/metabolite transporter (DMT)-like permease
METIRSGATTSPDKAIFTTTDWSLLAIISLIWGSAFLSTAIALEGFSAEAVAFLRIALGAAGLALIPSARRRIDREDWLKLLVVAIAGNAGPALLFATAIKTVDSAVAGMSISAVPLVSLFIWILINRSLPARIQLLGLVVGFAGVALVATPHLIGSEAAPLGIGLLALGTLGYAVTQNVIGPLQRKYGSTPVIFWALMIGSVFLMPLGATGLHDSNLDARTIVAIVILGVIATGFARSFAAVLTGRIGAVRGAVHGYFIPVLAVAFGVLLLGEKVTTIELAGLLIALAGGYLVTRENVPKVPYILGLAYKLDRGLQAVHRLRKGFLAS